MGSRMFVFIRSLLCFLLHLLIDPKCLGHFWFADVSYNPTKSPEYCTLNTQAHLEGPVDTLKPKGLSEQYEWAFWYSKGKTSLWPDRHSHAIKWSYSTFFRENREILANPVSLDLLVLMVSLWVLHSSICKHTEHEQRPQGSSHWKHLWTFLLNNSVRSRLVVGDKHPLIYH